jgi:2-alkyl-3-oxoalkanoate reductase
MKIIITGATGSLGAYLTRYFASKGHKVIACGQISNPPQKLLDCAEYYQADITKPFILPEADICIHTAALSDDKAELSLLIPANVTGTENTLKAAESCKIFIHISSSSVYLPSDEPLSEDKAGNQNNKLLSPYGYSKLLAEEVILKKSDFRSCFILRPRALYGIGDKMILPRLLKLVKNNKMQCPGNMKVSISMTHYRNLANAVDCCINSTKKGIHVYNVSDDKVYTLIEVMRKLTREIYGISLSEKQIPVWVLKCMAIFKIGGITTLLIRSLTHNMVLDISSIKSELNYKPETEFDLSLKELGGWIKRIGGPSVIKTGDKKLAWIE